MGVHRYRPARPRKLPADPLSRQIAAEFGRIILAIRLKRKLPRTTVVERTGINWKRIQALEEGWQVVSLDEAVRLADLYHVNRYDLFEHLMGGTVVPRLTVKPNKRKCLCEQLGARGRAALKVVVKRLAGGDAG